MAAQATWFIFDPDEGWIGVSAMLAAHYCTLGWPVKLEYDLVWKRSV